MQSAAHRSDPAARRRRGAAAWFVGPAATVIAALALSGPALAASVAPQSSTQGTAGLTTQGIIMKDGQICDPIRHIGC
jgi:hypothetical protein